MAKKPDQTSYDDALNLDPRKPTTQPDQPAAPAPKTRRGRKRKKEYQPEDVAPIGIGLTFAEGEELARMAAELGTNRHDLLLWLVRGFMRDWHAGKKPETEQKTVTVLKR